VLLYSGDNFPHLIQKRRSQLGFVTYLLNYPRIIFLQTALHASDDNLIHHQEHTQNCNYNIWHWSNRICYRPLSWKSRNVSTSNSKSLLKKKWMFLHVLMCSCREVCNFRSAATCVRCIHSMLLSFKSLH